MFSQPKVQTVTQTPLPAPNLADAENRMADSRRARLAKGGRNATVLGAMASEAAAKPAGPAKTLTGLQG